MENRLTDFIMGILGFISFVLLILIPVYFVSGEAGNFYYNAEVVTFNSNSVSNATPTFVPTFTPAPVIPAYQYYPSVNNTNVTKEYKHDGTIANMMTIRYVATGKWGFGGLY